VHILILQAPGDKFLTRRLPAHDIEAVGD
jgi:hypothetical protein